MGNRQLLVDFIPFEFDRKQLDESISKHNKLIVTGVLQRADAKNQNERIYPKGILMRESKRYLQEFVKQQRALGELDHPDSSVVNLQNTSHNILEMHWRADDLVGKIEVLGTPAGNILKELFKAGIKLGISSRGLGSIERMNEGTGDEADVVQDDFEIVAWDFVSNPSTHGAFMHPMNESVDTTTRTCGDWCKVEYIIGQILRGE